jgi:hypothetical protein
LGNGGFRLENMGAFSLFSWNRKLRTDGIKDRGNGRRIN